jgi:hypothetical protein
MKDVDSISTTEKDTVSEPEVTTNQCMLKSTWKFLLSLQQVPQHQWLWRAACNQLQKESGVSKTFWFKW